MRVILIACGMCGVVDSSPTRVYQRSDAEMLVLCDNGAFVATPQMLEGRYIDRDAATGTAMRGEDGQLAFELAYDAKTKTLRTPELGETPWILMDLSEVALDHANVLCSDVETRAWWVGERESQ